MRTPCLQRVEKFQNTVTGLIQWSPRAVERLRDEQGWSRHDSLQSREEGNSQNSLNYAFLWMTFPRSMTVKYPGLTLDAWRERVDNKVRKAHNLLWPSKRACGVRWDLSRRVVYWLWFQSLGRPSLLHPWSGVLDVNQHQLSKVQRLVCLGITEVMREGEVGAKTLVRCLYVSIVRPSIDFASLVCWPGCETDMFRHQLNGLRALGLRKRCAPLPPMQ
jgi:hypothetical protein